MFVQVVVSLILKVKNIAIFAAKNSFYFSEVEYDMILVQVSFV